MFCLLILMFELLVVVLFVYTGRMVRPYLRVCPYRGDIMSFELANRP